MISVKTRVLGFRNIAAQVKAFDQQLSTFDRPLFVMGCEVIMTSGNLEYRSRSTKFNRVLALPTGQPKYEI